MEQRLAEDQDGAYRDSLCRAFRGELAKVKRQLDSGLPPDEFQQASRLTAALETAISVVERIWRVEHNGGGI